jgi:hypothetical protein
MKTSFKIFASHHKNVSQAFENSSHSTSSSNLTSTSFLKTNLTSQSFTKLVGFRSPIHAHHLANLTNISQGHMVNVKMTSMKCNEMAIHGKKNCWPSIWLVGMPKIA